MGWHSRHRRRFAFRETSDPFRVLITEILLRQTQAVQVDAVWSEFFNEFPDAESLVRANSDRIRTVLRPLGISRRVEGIRQVASTIVHEHDGRVPADTKALSNLPGVGEYISGAVRWFAFGIPNPIADVNIYRVLGRFLGIGQKSALNRRLVIDFYGTLQNDRGSSKELHFALLDLAHLVCKPRKPHCQACPLRALCVYATKPLVG